MFLMSLFNDVSAHDESLGGGGYQAESHSPGQLASFMRERPYGAS